MLSGSAKFSCFTLLDTSFVLFYKQKILPFNLKLTAGRLATIIALCHRLLTLLATKALIRIYMYIRVCVCQTEHSLIAYWCIMNNLRSCSDLEVPVSSKIVHVPYSAHFKRFNKHLKRLSLQL